MRLFTSLKLGSYKPFALALLMLASTVFTAIFLPNVPEASALTANECYQYNNTLYNSNVVAGPLNKNRAAQEECFSLGYCALQSPRTDPIKCSDAVYKASDQYKAAQAAANNDSILNTQVTPVVKVICGEPSTNTQADAAYADCYAKTKARYVVCANGAEEGSPTEAEITSAIASCVRDWAKTTYPSKKIDINTLTTAVASGRNSGNDQATDIGAAQTKEECDTAQGTWADGKCAEKQAVLCSGGALGWIMCPLAELAVNITNFFAGVISSFMTFSPLLSSEQGDAIKEVWQLIVNIANVLLVIAFLMVVFSQATSVGLSNYGIKKMLPKIIAAAILMNLSFFICALAVDVANILGQSVGGIMQVGIDAVDLPPGSGTQPGATDEQNVFVAALGTVGLIGLAATGNIFLVLPILATAAVAVLTAFAVIIFRQVAIVIMIIISPLAFVAWVLPNTESWFEKWRKFFIALLAMFPIIMAIFYGSAFMSRIILVTLDTTKDGLSQAMVSAMALAVLVVPLFAMPFVMKLAGGVLERFGAWTNDRQKGLIDRTRNKSNEWKGRSAYQRGKEDRKNARNTRYQAEYANQIDSGKGRGRYRRFLAGGVPIGKGAQKDRSEMFRLASEQKRADIGSRVKRRNDELSATDFHSHGTKVYLASEAAGIEDTDLKDGTGRAPKPKAMHERLAAMASGENLVYYDGHGKRREIDTKQDQFYKYAAMHRIGETGDKKATAAAYMNQQLVDNASTPAERAAIIKELGGEDALRFSVKDPGDKAELMQELNSSQALSGSHPHFRKSEGGAFNNANAAQVATYSKDETMYAFQWFGKRNGNLQQELVNAQASGNQDSIRAAQKSVNDNKEAYDRLVNSYVDAIRNPNYQGTMDAGSVGYFERTTGMNASTIRSGGNSSQSVPQQSTLIVPPAGSSTPPQSTTPPAGSPTTPGIPTVQQQRQAGGNFGGFNNPPGGPPSTPPNNNP